MKIIEFDGVDFTYPCCEEKALSNISFSVESSDFVLLCGKSGCGKSTLLRHIKKSLAPYGKLNGNIFYKGQSLEELDKRVCASEIGFVRQNPDNQIVTDKVWHELAFGLESLGLQNTVIKRRVAEMASFFGIQSLFRKNVSELSGGQKQLVVLASVMVMKPRVLVLDEPTGLLDPISASSFISALKKINVELGTTIIISEHRLEELFPLANRVLVMDKGSLVINDTPQRAIEKIQAGACKDMFYGLPAVTKIALSCGVKKDCPLTVRDGLVLLTNMLGEPEREAENVQPAFRKSSVDRKNKTEEVPAILVKDVWFSYDKSGSAASFLRSSAATASAKPHCLRLLQNPSKKTGALLK